MTNSGSSVLLLTALFQLISTAQYNRSGADQTPLFQCQSSSQPFGEFYSPNIPDFYFNDTIVTEINSQNNPDVSRSGGDMRNTNIFIIPPQSPERECNGTITAVQYCYQADNLPLGREVNVIDVLLVTININRNRVFVNSRRRLLSTLSSQICTRITSTRMICCDIFPLNDQPIELPSSSFAFGVTNRNGAARPLVFRNSVYQVTQYFNRPQNSDLNPGGSFSVTERNDRSLAVLRFLIDSFDNASSTTETRTTLSSTTLPDTVSTSLGTRVPSTNSPPSLLGPIAGGVIGGVAFAGVLLVIVLLCLIVVRRQKRFKFEMMMSMGDTSTSTIKQDGEGAAYSAYGENVYYNVTKRLEEPIEYKVTRSGTNPNPYLEFNAIPYDEPVLPGTCVSANTDGLPSYNNVIDRQETEEEKSYYMTPATDEGGLYAQLNVIKAESFTRESITLKKKLGSGQFGVVYKGVWKSSDGDTDVAVKTLKEGSAEEDRVKFLQEAAIMGQFKHHNVVTMYGVVVTGEPILIVLELLPKKDLKKHLKKMQPNVTAADAHTLLSYCRQVAAGMDYLSTKLFIHRDLAARNILLSSTNTCKIADFGMSRDLMDENYYVSRGGKIPVKWTAPEALHYKRYSTASDVWSYGVLMYEIWSVGHDPFTNGTIKQVLSAVESGQRLPPPPGCPRALYSIMIQCWNPMASDRPKFFVISDQLSQSDAELLKWSEEDKAVHPEAATLGAALLTAQELYKDLQTRYNKFSSWLYTSDSSS